MKVVWIIAHGSTRQDWIEIVDKEIAKVDSQLTIVASFLENVEGRLITDGIKILKKLKATDVLVIPFFVSSGSTHILQIKEYLSRYDDDFNFIFTSCIDDHPYVVDHIINQALELSIEPSKEAILIIGHGSDQPEFHEKWESILTNLVNMLRKQTSYSEIRYATYYPKTIRTQLRKFDEELTVIVIPLFLSKGIFTNKRIPKNIKDSPVKYSGQAYISADWIPKWLESQIKSYFELTITV